MLSYTLKAGGDAQLHTEGWSRCSSTHRRLEMLSFTLKEEMLSYTLKAGGDAQLHTEGWRRCSASHDTTQSLTECNSCVCRRYLTAVA